MKKRNLGKKIVIIIAGFAVIATTICGGFSMAKVSAQAATTPCANGSYGDAEHPCATNRDIKKDTGNICSFPEYKDSSVCKDPSQIQCNGQDCGGIVSKIVNPGIRLASAVVAIIIAISIIAAGIGYGSAGGDPNKVSAAKKRMTNSIIALLAYIFMFALLQWLVPGGIV